jgi:hypothetical protein
LNSRTPWRISGVRPINISIRGSSRLQDRAHDGKEFVSLPGGHRHQPLSCQDLDTSFDMRRGPLKHEVYNWPEDTDLCVYMDEHYIEMGPVMGLMYQYHEHLRRDQIRAKS